MPSWSSARAGSRCAAARQAPIEAERLWPRLEAGYAEYARYRATRTLPIPIVILEPRG